MTAALQPTGYHWLPSYKTNPGKITFLEILNANSQKFDHVWFLENQIYIGKDRYFSIQHCSWWQKGQIKLKTWFSCSFFLVSLISEAVLSLHFPDSIFSPLQSVVLTTSNDSWISLGDQKNNSRTVMKKGFYVRRTIVLHFCVTVLFVLHAVGCVGFSMREALAKEKGQNFIQRRPWFITWVLD